MLSIMSVLSNTSKIYNCTLPTAIIAPVPVVVIVPSPEILAAAPAAARIITAAIVAIT